MKNLIWVLIVTLFTWNILISVALFNEQKTTSVNSEDNQVIINNEVNGFSTDLSEVVANVASKIVGVTVDIDGNESAGTGFIYDFDDDYIYVVVNYHVVDGSEIATVEFDNGESLTGEVLATDAYYDLAMIKINKEFTVEVMKLGDSSLVNKGEFVIAVGGPTNPDFDDSVDVGVISGVNRLLSIDIDADNSVDYNVTALQTNIAINAENTGGPLINMAGELIGINSLNLNTFDYDRINFALAINEVKPLLKKMLKGESISHPQMAITGKNVADLTNYQKSYYGISLDVVKGVYVDSVVADSNFAKGNLQVGDIILKVNEISIASMEDFKIALFNYDVGDIINLSVLRGADTVSLVVEIE